MALVQFLERPEAVRTPHEWQSAAYLFFIRAVLVPGSSPYHLLSRYAARALTIDFRAYVAFKGGPTVRQVVARPFFLMTRRSRSGDKVFALCPFEDTEPRKCRLTLLARTPTATSTFGAEGKANTGSKPCSVYLSPCLTRRAAASSGRQCC